MANYILTLSIGPVQGFIAAARRSRDLWCGSWLLSELAKAAAKTLHDAPNVTLIFPFVDNPNRLNGNSDFSVGNKIQVRCTNTDADGVRTLAEQAAEAARERFVKEAEDALKKLSSIQKDIWQALRKDIWQAQLNDYVEVQYAWAEEQNGDYQAACDNSSKLLAARKATRDFTAAAHAADDQLYFGLPKSSLDGARETVLHEKCSYLLRQKLGLSQSEQLDCAGIVKRLGGNPEQFTPITRIAADSWISKAKNDLQPAKAICKQLVSLQAVSCVKGNQSIYEDFPYDAQYLYPTRLEAAIRDAEKAVKQSARSEEAEQAQQTLNLLKQLKDTLTPVWEKHRHPCPYWVMLLADGDRMGKLLDKADSIEKHQEITQALSCFSGQVAQTMRKYRAHCIYAGGDDVLGLVPLDQAYACAKALSQRFSSSLVAVAKDLKSDCPTLSVGLAICHMTTPLGQVRRLAKQAEQHAKGDHLNDSSQQRNALGIVLSVRSGSDSTIRLHWDDKCAHAAFQEWIAAFQNDQISSRIAYDSRSIFTRTDFPLPIDGTLLNSIRQTEFDRMLDKARLPNGQELSQDIKTKLNNRLQQTGCLNQLATELIIARWLAAKTENNWAD